jgi:hypothetical protein
MTVRAKIDIASGIFELEGDKEFVAEHLEKLLPIISKFQPPAARQRNDDDADPGEQPKSDDEGEAERKKRRTAKRSPGAPTCRSKILELRSKGFFKTNRTPTEIKAGVKADGWTFEINQITAALSSMLKKGEIRRTSDGGTFKYYSNET